jgi:predicted nucleic acid-binding protein
MLDWAADLRGTSTSTHLERAVELAAQLMDMPILQVDEFIDNYAELLDSISERLDRGEAIELSLSLALDVDDNVINECLIELNRATGQHR